MAISCLFMYLFTTLANQLFIYVYLFLIYPFICLFKSLPFPIHPGSCISNIAGDCQETLLLKERLIYVMATF